MREIKFRGFSPIENEWVYGGITSRAHAPNNELQIVTVSQNEDESRFQFVDVLPETIGQFTGLKDKNGVDIYDGELLRIKGIMGNMGEYEFDSIFQVYLSTHEGLSIRFIKLTSKFPDSRANSYPMHVSASFSSRSLSLDYRNNKYDSLALCDHYYDDSSRRRHQDHHYTNDIEVIGNIYQNPELLNTSAS